MDAYKGALPQPTPETKPFWDAAKGHTLALPWCLECGKAHFYPRPFCPHCFGWRLEWRPASGRGRIHTYVISHKPARGFDGKTPYVIAVVELAEGPRMLTNILVDGEPTPQTIAIEAEVEVVFDDVTPEIALPKFRLVQGGRQ